MNDMRIGETGIDVSVGAKTLLLRPTLRCAYRLHSRYDGFEPLARRIADGTLSVLADVITEASTGEPVSRVALEATLFDDLPALEELTHTMLAFLFTLCGMEETSTTDTTETSPGTTPMSLSDFYERLFRIATGWLGWTPETAWHATPAEIIKAYKGRCELLSAIFGGTPDDTSETSMPNLNDKLDHEGLEALKAMGGL
jgi:hypothetical protein